LGCVIAAKEIWACPECFVSLSGESGSATR